MPEAIDFTTCVAVDRQHADELEIAWPTWRAFRPEIMAAPLHVYCDERESWGFWEERLSFIEHPDWQPFWAGGWPGVESQRERMLSALVALPPLTVKTKYFLKIDTDCIATGPGEFPLAWWFDDDPVFVSSPWGYTKPADAIKRLDDWGDTIPGVREFPRLGIPFDPAGRLVRHQRIISYLYFGRRDWHFSAAMLARERLPVPSQDTYCWYVAERTKQFYRRVKMSRYGWRHINGIHRLRAAAAEALHVNHAEPTTHPAGESR